MNKSLFELGWVSFVSGTLAMTVRFPFGCCEFRVKKCEETWFMPNKRRVTVAKNQRKSPAIHNIWPVPSFSWPVMDSAIVYDQEKISTAQNCLRFPNCFNTDWGQHLTQTTQVAISIYHLGERCGKLSPRLLLSYPNCKYVDSWTTDFLVFHVH